MITPEEYNERLIDLATSIERIHETIDSEKEGLFSIRCFYKVNKNNELVKISIPKIIFITNEETENVQ